MPFSTEIAIHARFLRSVAGAALAVMLSTGLAGCGGGGSAGGAQVMIVPDPQVPAQDQQSPPQESPDLVVESPSVSDPAPAAGASITISAMVRNAGSGAAPAAKVRFYRSADAAITASDEEVGASSSAELAVSGVGAASVEVPAPQAPGTYYYGACAAAVSGESGTANNCSASVQVRVPGSAASSAQPQPQEQQQPAPPLLVRQVPKQALPRPDLVAGSPSSSDANPLPGADFTFSVAVRNAGDGAAAATTVRFYLSSDAAITASDAQAGSADVAELAPSGSAVASAALTAPQSPGTYYYGACVAAVSGESDTANNCSASVRVTVPGLPDLVVKSPFVDKTSPLPEELIRLTAKVRNAGGKGSAATRVHFLFSKDATLTMSDVAVGRDEVHGLTPSQTKLVYEYVLSPSSPGVYYFGACVDPVTGESDTTNNCSASVRIAVQSPHPPDIVFARFWTYPTFPAAGGVFALRTEMRNTGGKTGAVRMRYYRSDDATFTSSDPQVGSYTEEQMFARSKQWASIVQDSPDDPGTYYYRVCADAVENESDTTNNCSAALKVEVKRSRPNLKITSSHRGNWRGSRFMLAVGVENAGGPSPETTVRFYHSTDSKITTDDTELLSVPLPALRKTQSQTVPKYTIPWVLVPGPTTTGIHYYGACIDPVPDESDTTDNCAWVHRIIRE